MIIWSGHGILIILFWVVGGLIGGLAGTAGIFIGAAAMGWVYALTIGKTKVQTLIDPRTGSPVILTSRHSVMLIPVFFWAIVMSAVALLGIVISLTGSNSSLGSGTSASSAFAEAEKWIGNPHQNVAGSGNTEIARKAASEFSSTLTLVRKVAVTNASSGSTDFPAWCQITPHGVAFLVQVPQLRKFTQEAKDTMTEFAWMSARRIADGMNPKPKNLAVGVKGMILYEKILVGVTEGDLDKNEFAGVNATGKDSNKEILAPFFAAVPEVKAPLVKESQKGEPGNTALEKAAPAPLPKDRPVEETSTEEAGSTNEKPATPSSAP